MPKIKITNPRNVIEAPIKKNYFKIRATSGPKGDKGDTGATGPQGPQGPQGNAATIYVGSTTTLPVGQNATVENVGSQYAAVLNFGIPQGPQGPQGAKGDKGDKGDKGEQGNTGNTGPAGQNATVYIGTTTTGAPGSQASVYNSGTENNAVLNFTIPQGAKGDTGATGATGPQGPAGQDGKDFAPSVVDSLPAVGEENKLYLTPKAHTAQTATGNPITATITDGAGQIEDFQLDGDTFQQSYSGKNLYKNTLPDISGTCSVVYKDSTITLNGARGTGNLQNTSNIGTRLTAGTYTIRAFLLGGSASGNGTRLITRIDNNTFTVRSDISGASEPLTVTLDSDTDVKLQIWVDNSTTFNNLEIGFQIETGSSSTDFEPYVGGIASPNPSYPQPIQVVTGEQTVSKVGKNLFDKNNYQDIRAFIQSDGIIRLNDANRAVYIPCEPNTTYTVSHIALPAGSNKKFGVAYSYVEPQGGTQTYGFIRQDSATSITITTDADARYLIAWLWVNDYPITYLNYLATVQIEKGSTPTTYAPYSKTDYPISLGSIELCKLGTYQDYIYKDGDTWKVHKTMSKVLIDGTTGTISSPSTNRFNLDNCITDYKKLANSSFALCDQYISLGQTDNNAQFNTNASSYKCCINFGSATASVIRFKNTKISTSDDFADALENHPLTMYYALATATDTAITDATLISQLNAIASASLENGSNTITNTATGSNLAGDMEVDYFGYDPTNRYDKWLWLDINNAYEKLGS